MMDPPVLNPYVCDVFTAHLTGPWYVLARKKTGLLLPSRICLIHAIFGQDPIKKSSHILPANPVRIVCAESVKGQEQITIQLLLEDKRVITLCFREKKLFCTGSLCGIRDFFPIYYAFVPRDDRALPISLTRNMKGEACLHYSSPLLKKEKHSLPKWLVHITNRPDNLKDISIVSMIMIKRPNKEMHYMALATKGEAAPYILYGTQVSIVWKRIPVTGLISWIGFSQDLVKKTISVSLIKREYSRSRRTYMVNMLISDQNGNKPDQWMIENLCSGTSRTVYHYPFLRGHMPPIVNDLGLSDPNLYRNRLLLLLKIGRNPFSKIPPIPREIAELILSFLF